jgi:hypothetical protein
MNHQRKDEIEKRERAYEHRDEVVEGSGEILESWIPAHHRERLKGKIGPVRRIYPDDPDWICGKDLKSQDGSSHGCHEMHNSTGDPTHKCCCEFEWND